MLPFLLPISAFFHLSTSSTFQFYHQLERYTSEMHLPDQEALALALQCKQNLTPEVVSMS